MFTLPALLSLLGVVLGPPLARSRNECPHRGKVWGAFLLPLLALLYQPLQFQALGASLAGALGAGFTAHQPVKTTLGVVAVLASGLCFGLNCLGV